MQVCKTYQGVSAVSFVFTYDSLQINFGTPRILDIYSLFIDIYMSKQVYRLSKNCEKIQFWLPLYYVDVGNENLN